MPVRERTRPGVLPHARPRRLTAPAAIGRRRSRHRDRSTRPGLPPRGGHPPDPAHPRHGEPWTDPFVGGHGVRARRQTDRVRRPARRGPVDPLVLGHRSWRPAPEQASELHRAHPRAHGVVPVVTDAVPSEQHGGGEIRSREGRARACGIGQRRFHERGAAQPDRRRLAWRASSPVALQGRCRPGRDHRTVDHLHPRDARRRRRHVAGTGPAAPDLIRCRTSADPSRAGGRPSLRDEGALPSLPRHDRRDLPRHPWRRGSRRATA